MTLAKRGDWVEIKNTLLESGKRSPKVPEDTQKVPCVQYIKGFLQSEEAGVGSEVTITTLIGRTVTGQLIDPTPRHVHDFGQPIVELIEVGTELRKEIEAL